MTAYPYPSDYVFFLVGDTAIIEDLNQGNASVTNDAENVIREIHLKCSDNPPNRFVYRDSDGLWCEMKPAVGDVQFAHLEGQMRSDDLRMRHNPYTGRMSSKHPSGMAP